MSTWRRGGQGRGKRRSQSSGSSQAVGEVRLCQGEPSGREENNNSQGTDRPGASAVQIPPCSKEARPGSAPERGQRLRAGNTWMWLWDLQRPHWLAPSDPPQRPWPCWEQAEHVSERLGRRAVSSPAAPGACEILLPGTSCHRFDSNS